MSLLIAANVVTALAAFGLMGLVTVGFAPHLRWRGHDANSMMSIFVASVSGVLWVRSLWWSLVRPFLGEVGVMLPYEAPAWAYIVNIGFDIGAICAALAALGALYLSLPHSERKYYNLLTVPFYPRRFNVVWRW